MNMLLTKNETMMGVSSWQHLEHSTPKQLLAIVEKYVIRLLVAMRMGTNLKVKSRGTEIVCTRIELAMAVTTWNMSQGGA